MNIKDHYSFMSKLYLQQTVLFAVVFIVVILPNMKRTDFLLTNMAGVAVFLFAVYYFFRCVYFTFKKNAVSFALVHSATSLHGNTYLLFPSHNSQTVLEAYSSDGIRRWSILSLKGRERRERLRYFSLGEKGRIFKVHEHGNGHTGYMYINLNDVIFLGADKPLKVTLKREKGKQMSFIIESDCYQLKKPYSDRLLYKNGQAVMTVKKGLMPVTWQQFFHPNTPQLKFAEQLTVEERGLCLCLITLF
ncbi:hypothetical protein JOC94_003392 [Bacillus thermophilus]|uniref:Uncharacterized protein n=1 Tax=Siminovitchia thermophila TaxID=1245522 RepID=A0ABS2R9P8_9BACI|nr:hypothetical protein [Siminovitchia thermophila]MBM7716372.1 hypothetical protein [Siminovitchia thermophila]ONK21994.1 hypothetical protein BLX87_19020 [Bacillus sp. VT-16-64]